MEFSAESPGPGSCAAFRSSGGVPAIPARGRRVPSGGMSASANSDPAGGVAGGSASTDPPALQPLPYDGVVSVAVGTVLWAVAALVMLVFLDDLRDDGHLWWLATAICGFGLGLAGLWIVIRRRNRLRGRQG